MAVRWLDRVLIVLFLFAAFVGFYYEPVFFLHCGWAGLHQGAGGACSQDWVGRAWLAYLKVEPYYADAPLFLQLVNEFDTLLFGWLYLLSIFVFFTGRQTRGWYKSLATFVSGMMAYAMTYYLTWESLTYHQTGANIRSVFFYNGLWLLIFALLLARLYLLAPRTAAAGRRQAAAGLAGYHA
ncbi:MAG: hypothetical protein P4L83_11735 [Nevskia sp.]|nr:hypothetical protein [Nevskia sp.]